MPPIKSGGLNRSHQAQVYFPVLASTAFDHRLTWIATHTMPFFVSCKDFTLNGGKFQEFNGNVVKNIAVSAAQRTTLAKEKSDPNAATRPRK